MINLKPFYKNILCSSLYLSLASLPLSACSAGLVEIKNHPIDTVVEQNKNPNPSTSKTAVHKINQMRIMHIDIDYIYDKDKQQQQNNINELLKRINIIQPNTIAKFLIIYHNRSYGILNRF